MHCGHAVCRRALRVGFVFLIVGLGMFVKGAAAQGTSNMLPDPISTRELMEYGKRLELSEQQQQALMLKHDHYKAEFDELRQGEIAAFLTEMRAISGSMPQRQQLEDFLKRMDKLQGAIERLDSSLFDSIIPLLTEKQLAILPRVRLARDRDRYPLQQMMWGQQGPMVDVSELLEDIDLSEEEILRVDPQMAMYERNLTQVMGELHELSLRMWLDIYDAMEARGFSEEDMQDPEKAGKAMQMMQEIFREVAAEARSKAVEIGELSRKVYDRARLQLTDNNATRLRRLFIVKRYPEINMLDANLRLQFSYFLRQADPGDEVKQVAMEIADRYETQIESIENDGMDLIDQWRAESDPFSFQDGGYTEFNRKLTELRTKAIETQAATLRQLGDLLDAEAYAALTARQFDAAGNPIGQDQQAQAAGGSDSGGSEASEDDSEDRQRQLTDIDEFVAAPISERDLQTYTELMGLDDGQLLVMKELHKTYLEQCDVIKKEKVQPIAERTQKFWTDEAGLDKAQIVERNHTDRISAIDAMRAADEGFFDELDILVVNEDQKGKLKRARQLRERAAYSVVSAYGAWVSASQEASIDLAMLLETAQMSDAAIQQAAPIVDEYIQRTTPLLKDRFMGSIAMNRASLMWQVRTQEAKAAGEQQPIYLEYQEMLKEPYGRLHRSTTELRTINAETLDRLLTSLASDDGLMLRESYYKRAFPDLMDDARAAGPYLDRAAQLDSLSPQQRDQLRELGLGYHAQYDQYTQQIIDAYRVDMPNWYSADDQEAQQERWKAYQQQQEKLEEIKFRRNEMNDRLLGRLWIVLTAEQRSEIDLAELQLAE